MLLLNQKTQLFLKGGWPPKITSAILLVLIGLWLFFNVLPLLTEKKSIASPVSIVSITPLAPKTSSLKNINLFGEIKKAVTANKSIETKPTKLALTLTGVLATSDPKLGIAQIQNASKLEKHFSVNDLVFGKATLEEVYLDHVILLHNGRREILSLPEKSLNTQHFLIENKKQKRKETATNYREIFLSGDGDELTKLFGFDTAWKHGGFAGFVIKALGEKGIEMMDILGIQDGDIIVVVNGLRLSESLEATQQLTELKHATSVDIVIDRNGEEIPFHIEFDAPIADSVDVGNITDKLSNNTTPENTNNTDLNTGNNTGNNIGGNIRNNTSLNFNSNPSNAPSRKPYKNKITEDGKTDRSGFTQSLIDSNDDVEDLEPDWDETPEGIAYKLKQRERTTGKRREIEIDH